MQYKFWCVHPFPTFHLFIEYELQVGGPPVALQVFNLGVGMCLDIDFSPCGIIINFPLAIVIIAAKVFWQTQSGVRQSLQRVTDLYLFSGTAVAVKVAISEAFTNYNGSFDTEEVKAQLLQIALENQLGMFMNC